MHTDTKEIRKADHTYYNRVQHSKAKSGFYLRLLFITILLNLVFLIHTFGQMVTVKNATVTTTADITVKGDISVESGAAIHNNGLIKLSGNWTNNSSNTCFGISQGTVIMNGANQESKGLFPTEFHNLTLEGGTLTLFNDIYTDNTGILNVSNGKIILNSRTVTVNNPAPGAIAATTGIIVSEETDNSSKVKWNIGNSSGNHVIPFGDVNNNQIPLVFNLQSGNAGVVTMSTYHTSPDNLPLPVTPVAVTHVRDAFGNDNSANTLDRFWQVDASGSPVATITFTYDGADMAANGNSSMQAQRWNALMDGWDPPAGGQTNPNSQSTTVSNVSAFGAWTLSQQSTPLPVKLLYFDAKAVSANEVHCTWATATEEDNDFYTIERSQDGYNFEKAGIVDGSGTSVSMLEYDFTDHKPYKGVSYYRLKQTDFNGAFSYSEIVAVRINEEGMAMQVFPNPATEYIQITSDEEESFLMTLTDPSGKLISEFMHEQFSRIELDRLAPGMYFLVARTADGNIKNTFRIKKI